MSCWLSAPANAVVEATAFQYRKPVLKLTGSDQAAQLVVSADGSVGVARPPCAT